MLLKSVPAKSCLLLVSLLAIHAHAARYNFDDEKAWLSDANAMAAWQETLDKHQQQRAALLACEGPRGCRGRLKSFNRMLQKGQSLSVDEKIELTNYYINRNRYDDDRFKRLYDEDGNKVGVLRSQWTTLYDFLMKAGDCEDYATSKYFMLRELGLPADDMRVVAVYSRELGGYHAILAVRRDNGSVWLLDSDNRIRKGRHQRYRYIYALNEHSIWDHRKDYAGSPRLTAPHPIQRGNEVASE